MDFERRIRDHPEMAWHSRRSPFDRTRSLVAFLLRSFMGNQRRDFLRAGVHDGPVAAIGADRMGGFPQRPLDGASVSIAAVPHRPQLDELQQPATTCLF